MIKTHEDWEHVKTVAELQSGPSLQHAVDTIEALREVARAADRLEISYDMRTGDMTIDGFRNQIEDLERAIDAIPDWITENGR